MLDVIVLGGGPAGKSAAHSLGFHCPYRHGAPHRIVFDDGSSLGREAAFTKTTPRRRAVKV